MFSIESISFGYSKSVPIFNDFSWRVESRDSWTIVGPSGCGKSTLLYMLAGLKLPDHGVIKINNEPLSRPRPETGLILQDYGLLPWATVQENAQLGLSVRKFYGPDGTHAPVGVNPEEDPSEWLQKLGIQDIASQYPSQISGGQRQRTAIARTLALHPDLLLMDEPFSSLDATIRSDLQDLTLKLCAENNITMVMVTHSIEEAILLGQKILFLGNPPHHELVWLDNPHLLYADFIKSDHFSQMNSAIRQLLESA